MNFFRRFFSPRSQKGENDSLPGLLVGVKFVQIQEPIPLTERKPDGPAWFAAWDSRERCWGAWNIQDRAWSSDTHWLPANTEVLPGRCYPPQN